MNSSSDGTRAADAKGISLSRAMVFGMTLWVSLFGLALGLLVWLSVDQMTSSRQTDHLDRLQGSIGTEIRTYLDDRSTILKDLAALPILVQGVMQPAAARENLADFLDASSLIGLRCKLTALDFEGAIIHSTQEHPSFDYGQTAWISSLIDGEEDRYIGISHGESDFFWRIAVPVLYHDLAEGILVAEIPLLAIDRAGRISEHLGKCQLDFFAADLTIASLGPHVDAQAETVSIEELGLLLRFRVDDSANRKERNALLLRLAIFLLGLSLTFYLGAMDIGKRVLVSPLERLRRWTSSLGTSLETGESVAVGGIREIDYLARDFERMIERLKIRDRALHRARDTLEQRVDERTRELENEVSRRELILRGINDGVLVTDLDFRLILINEVAREMLGSGDDAKLKGAELSSWLPLDEESAGRLESDLSGESGSGIWTLPGEEASSFRFAHNRFSDESGKPAGRVFILHDITEELAVNRLKSDFVSSVSHELRTPLTSIKGFTATILRDPDMSVETRIRFLNIIDDESSRLGNLVEDLLEISRVESGQIELRTAPVAIDEIAKRAHSVLEPVLRKKELDFTMEIETGLPAVLCDLQKTQTIIYNLLENAAKFTASGGRIGLKLEREGEQVKVVVSDTGIGISAIDQEKIFQRFYRGNPPGLKVSGTGLGLSIVKELVEIQNGEIEVWSSPGEGSTFTVRLPLAL